MPDYRTAYFIFSSLFLLKCHMRGDSKQLTLLKTRKYTYSDVVFFEWKCILQFDDTWRLYLYFWDHVFVISFTWRELADRWEFARAVHLLKNMGLRRQAVSHLQHPSGPAEVSRLLSVSEAKVWSVDMEEISLTDEEGGRLSLLFTAAPALREATEKRLQRKKEPSTQQQYDKRSRIRTRTTYTCTGNVIAQQWKRSL